MKQKTARSNTKFALIFFVFLIFVVAISFLIKFIILIKHSQVNNLNRFNLSINTGKNSEVISLSSDSKNISIFKLDRAVYPSEAGKYLEIPINGYINYSNLNLNQKTENLLLSAFLNYQKINTNLTVIDLLKLAFFARSAQENHIDISLENLNNSENKISQLVRDFSIEKDNQTIEIINAAEITGLGNRLAKFIGNMGGNVIIVTTGDVSKKSEIHFVGKKTYTVRRLAEILNYDIAENMENPISDIKIIIGEDKINKNPF